jgi:type VI secretion system protein ImpL
MLKQFEAVEQIRQMYFASNGQLPDLQFTLTPGDLDLAATRFTLEMDGQTLDYRHGPPRGIPVHWPGPSPGVAAITFEDKTGTQPSQAFQGPWAWFRLMDAAVLQPVNDTRFTVAIKNSGHQATVIIDAASIRNPYLRSPVHQFRCNS